MKNFLIKAIIVLTILFISLFTLHHFLYDFINENAVVSVENLNIRVKPTIDDDPSSIIIKLSQGDRLEFVGLVYTSSNGFTWARVKVTLEDGTIEKGYCVYTYITLDETSETEASEVVPSNPS